MNGIDEIDTHLELGNEISEYLIEIIQNDMDTYASQMGIENVEDYEIENHNLQLNITK